MVLYYFIYHASIRTQEEKAQKKVSRLISIAAGLPFYYILLFVKEYSSSQHIGTGKLHYNLIEVGFEFLPL